MERKIVSIDEDLCIGCGLCVSACHEGAIGLVDGKARLLRDDYCDGLGDCLPACPTNAITFVVREAAAYDEAAVAEHLGRGARELKSVSEVVADARERESCLSQWPVQIKLVSPNAAWLDGADLLIAADCTAFARADFHERFIDGRKTLVGCPKLDGVDYAEKLASVFALNDIASVTLARMEVPCCGGLQRAVESALEVAGKDLPVDVVTISCDGRIVS